MSRSTKKDLTYLVIMVGLILTVALVLEFIPGDNASETFTKSIKKYIEIQESNRSK